MLYAYRQFNTCFPSLLVYVRAGRKSGLLHRSGTMWASAFWSERKLYNVGRLIQQLKDYVEEFKYSSAIGQERGN